MFECIWKKNGESFANCQSARFGKEVRVEVRVVRAKRRVRGVRSVS